MADDTAVTTTMPEGSTVAYSTSTPEPLATDDLGDPGKKALETERTARKEAERQRKALERELDQLRTASLSEAERAVAEAKAAGRTEAVTEFAARLAGSEFRAAAATVGIDVTDLLEDINLSRFVGADGEPDSGAIGKAVERFAALRGTTPRTTGDASQGVRTQALALNGDPLTNALKSKLGIQ